MAESSSAAHVPVRSVSLPTRLIHPKAQRVEEELKKLQSLRESSSSAPSRVQLGLARLVELYDFVNEQVICSPQGQQALGLPQHVKLVEDALDESIALLDVCDFTRDLIGAFKEQIQDLQSALRRRGGDFSRVEADIRAYTTFQKKHKKAAAKQLRSLARIQTRTDKKPSSAKCSVADQHLSMVSNILKQSNSSAIFVFVSLLEFLSSPAAEETKGNNGRWSLLGKLMTPSRANKAIDVQGMLRRLATLNMSLGAVHEELSCLSRRLIQHRVSLLNILTP